MQFRPLLALLLLAACDGPADKETDGPDYDTDTDSPPSVCADRASVAVSVGEGALTGPVALTVTLTDAQAEAADLTLEYSLDGAIWLGMTVAEPLTGLASSAAGTPHTFTWDTEGDLGRTLNEGVRARAVARSATCNPWPLGALDELTINNSVIPEPVCGVVITSVEQPVEGPALVRFTLTHPQAAPTTVELSWSTTPETTAPIHTLPYDCDGDGADDGLADLSTSPEGEEHCVLWNSQEDVGVDTDATLQAACFVQGIQQDLYTGEPTPVRNDPAPSPGEVAITELMPEPASASGHYIELVNTSGHMLDLQGLRVERWRSANPRTNPPDRAFDVMVTDGVLLANPGDRILLGASDDPVASACRVPDAVWPDTFTLRSDSVLVLSYAGTLIGELSFFDAAGFNFDEGTSWGLDGAADPATYAEPTARWCASTSVLPGCAEVPVTGELGTPGVANDVCPI